MSTMVKFDFHGDRLDVMQDGEKVWVSVRRVCEALGLRAHGQAEKLKTKPWAGIQIICAPSPGGAQETLCIDLESLPMWLATLEPSRVAVRVRDKLVRYQREAARVLADHFLGPRALPSAAASPPALTQADVERLIGVNLRAVRWATELASPLAHLTVDIGEGYLAHGRRLAALEERIAESPYTRAEKRVSAIEAAIGRRLSDRERHDVIVAMLGGPPSPI